MKSLICAVTVLAASTAGADTIYVDVANCPGGDGSELDPYCTIQTAIDNAVDTDEIVVAPGTYFEAIDLLSKAVNLHSSDGPEVTTIDGTGNFHVVQCISGEGSDTVIDGFTITGGNANGAFPHLYFGGGMYNSNNSSPTVTNCTFTGNLAIGGGGMCNSASSPTVTNCTFTGNSATAGGGIYNYASSNPTVTDCTFRGNSAGNNGGGMSNSNNSSPTVSNCSFIGNSSSGTAGGMISFDGHPVVTNCTFIDNTADSAGGGMYNHNDTDAMVTYCAFNGNSASQGGGMNNQGNHTTVTNCTFTGNSVTGSGGGMLNVGGGSPTVTNCTFDGNSGAFGGGLGVDTGTTVSNCTFRGNMATSTGGAIYFLVTNPTVNNCILWDNQPDEIDGSLGTPAVSYSNVQGGWPGDGNIDADPLFVDADNGDFRLLAGSPCIDAGHNNAIADLADTDLDGNPRFAADKIDFDPGCGIPVVVDMGAYEYQGDPFPVKFGDIDGDGIVGTVDFLALLDDWGSCVEKCCLSDLDLDGNVGIIDFLLLLGNWG